MHETTINIGGDEYTVTAWEGECPSLPDLSVEDWTPLADDCWTNGYYDVYRWNLDDKRYLYLDCDNSQIETVTVSDEDIESHLSSWEHEGDVDNWIAEWGIEPTLTVAKEGHEGPCRVWRRPQYHQGTNDPPRSCYAGDDDNEILEFTSYAEAAAYVHDYYNEPSCYDGIRQCNVMSHGQAGADRLTIVAVDD